MTHRMVMRAISGLLLAMFAAGVSGTVVATGLPRIIADLNGRQTQYAWIVTATLLSATATGPIWGKLADRMSRKLLLEISILTLALGALLAGSAPNVELLIGFRVLQGIGVGGLLPLVQIVLGSLISPRERGRYLGYFVAASAVAMIAGPPLGGLIVDTPFLGWRWCFWLEVPFAIAALILLRRTLHLPTLTRDTRIDWLGALLIPSGICVLLIWLTQVGTGFSWASWNSAALVTACLVLLALAVIVEHRVPDPIVPPRLIRQRTMGLAIVADMALIVTAVSSAVFLAQYFQLARGHTPTESGLLTLPMVIGVVAAAALSGRHVTRTGRWKRTVTAGTTFVVVGLLLLGSIDHTTSLILVASYMGVLGIGMGASTPHIIVAVQNSLDDRDLGAGTATVTFFGSLAGAAGVAVLGVIFAIRASDLLSDSLKPFPDSLTLFEEGGLRSADLAQLPTVAQNLVQSAYGDATATVFLAAAAAAIVALVAIACIRDEPLRSKIETDAREVETS